jgi:hypothetical protein
MPRLVGSGGHINSIEICRLHTTWGGLHNDSEFCVLQYWRFYCDDDIVRNDEVPDGGDPVA